MLIREVENIWIMQNHIHDNLNKGMSFMYNSNITITANEFRDNVRPNYSIYFTNPDPDVKIRWNNFYDAVSLQSWFITSNNYFDNYSDVDADGDGIWDNPYSVYTGSDPTPLVNPFEVSDPDIIVSQTRPDYIDLSWNNNTNNYDIPFYNALSYSTDGGLSWTLIDGNMSDSITSYEFDASVLAFSNYMFRIVSTAFDNSYATFDVTAELISDDNYSTQTTDPTTPVSTSTSDEGGLIGANFFFGLFVIAIPLLKRRIKR